ncbi:MAG: 5'-nucleotidase [Saprospiraceae bacterium]
MLFLLIVCSSCKVNHFVRVDSESYPVENSLNVPEDSAVLALVSPYRRQLEQGMNQIIGSIAMDLEEATGNQTESLLGNFVAEAFQVKAVDYTKGKVDFSVVNSGGLRISMLPKGPIKKSLIYELLPFENILVILELDGATVRTFVNHMRDSGVWPVSEGLYYQITQSGVGEIRINGALLEADKVYHVAMPDYIANGGGDSDFLIDIPQLSTQKLLRDVVIEFIQESPGPVGAEITGRIEFKN